MDNLANAILSYYQDAVFSTESRNRVVRLAAIKRNILYNEGKQYLLRRYSALGNAVIDYTPLTINDLTAAGIDPNAINDPIYNQVRSLGRKFQSALAQRSPNCQAEALVETDELQAAAARAVTKIIQAFRKQWPSEEIQRKITFAIFLKGTPFARIKWIVDKEQFGTSQIPLGEPIEGPEGMVQFYSEEPNGMPIPEIFSEEEVCIPALLREWKDVPFLLLSEDVRVGDIIRRYPGAEAILTKEPGNYTHTGNEKYYRANLRGANRRNYEELNELYLSPIEYPLVAWGKPDLLKELDAQFPKGLKAVIVRNYVLSLEPAVLKNEWSTCIPDFSDTILCDPIITDAIQGQDALNTQMGIMHETLEGGLPLTLVNSNGIDIEALRKAAGSISGRIMPIDTETAGRLADQLYNLPQASPDPRTVEWTRWVVEMSKELIGILPAIYGGDVGVTQTAYEAERRLNQALMQLAIVWASIRELWTGIYTNALRMVAERPSTALEEYGVTENDLLILRECFKTGSLKKVKISVEESIPATRSQIGALVREILQLGPPAMALLGADSPENASRIRDALGLVGWNSTTANLREWVRLQIQGLVNEAPMMGGMDPETGQSIPAQPSRPVDPTYGDPQLIGALGANWLITEGERLIQENPGHPGYENVLLWVRGYQELAQQMMAPTPPPEVR